MAHKTDNLPGSSCEICGSPFKTDGWGKQSVVFGFSCVRCVSKASRCVRRHNRRAKLAGSPGKLYPADWLSIQYAYGFSCSFCGTQEEDLTLDHRRCLSAGGQNLAFNVQPLCQRCHRIKDNLPKKLDKQPDVS